VYETPEQITSRLPDFRNQLFWAPELKTNGQGKAQLHFYTSDQKGDYIVVVQGLNAEGRSGVQRFRFTVQ
jgi:penicillin V acylase-like amidase (Ntn superfamily)